MKFKLIENKISGIPVRIRKDFTSDEDFEKQKALDLFLFGNYFEIVEPEILTKYN